MRSFVFLLACALASAPALAEEGRISIALLDVKPKGAVSPELPPSLTALASTHLQKKGVFQVVTQADVRRMLDFEGAKMALGCEAEASCLAEVGGALGVPYLLTGTLARLEDTYIIHVVLIDIDDAKTIGRETLSTSSVSELTRELPSLLERVVAPLLYAEAGVLSVTATEEGATVRIDDVAVGTTPLRGASVPAGLRKLTVSKDGFIQFQKDVVIPPREDTSLEVALIPSKEFLEAYKARALTQSLLAWGALGAALLSAGGSAGLFAWNEVEVQRLREEQGKQPGEKITVGEAVQTAQLARDVGGFSLAGLSVALLGTSAFFFVVGEPIDRYDHLPQE